MRAAWLFGLALGPLSPSTFDASFDDCRIAPDASGDALGIRQIVNLIENLDAEEHEDECLLDEEDLSVPTDPIGQSLADFQAAHADTPFHSVFDNFRGTGFPPVQTLEALSKEMLHSVLESTI